MDSVNHNQMFEEENNYPNQNNIHPPEDINQNNSQSQKIEGFDEEINASQINEALRAGFIIKVYGIVAFQLTISILFIGCSFIPSYSLFLSSTTGIVLLFVSLPGCLIIGILLSCFPKIARRIPINYILLVIFTVFQSYALQFICTAYDFESILIAGGLTIAMVVSLALYSLKTKTDYTWKGAFLFTALIISIISGIFLIFFWRSYWLQTLCAISGVLLFSAYLIYDIQLISGKFGASFTIDDYIMAAMNIYMDIINLFIRLLEIFGSRR